MKKISKKNNKEVIIPLAQVLENGIWSLEVVFNNIMEGFAGIGIVRNSYTITDKCESWKNPFNKNAIFTDDGYNERGKVTHNGKGTAGNKGFTDSQIVRLEMNFNNGTLTFFYEGVQQPVYVTGINEKVKFYITINRSCNTCTIRTLKKLSVPTAQYKQNGIPVQWCQI
ncbi:MAG: hypothetical protein EZS28_031204 [Streblomastix strix]|uniref:B30.2/SPRY domain-containing protein n=1 Tax=Streblomastix strix TaxID=222440 RepID=A0A5J4US93_9EUKA|nr:MAG: hypothetical protein EZS28_031204 [Streblomastix strix]